MFIELKTIDYRKHSERCRWGF